MVGRDVQRVDALCSHVPHEVQEIAAVGLDRVVRQKHIADPGHERPGGTHGLAAGGLERRARKASTFSAAGASPSRSSLRSCRSGVAPGLRRLAPGGLSLRHFRIQSSALSTVVMMWEGAVFSCYQHRATVEGAIPRSACARPQGSRRAGGGESDPGRGRATCSSGQRPRTCSRPSRSHSEVARMFPPRSPSGAGIGEMRSK